MSTYIIEIRGKAYAANAGEVVAYGVVEGRNPWEAAYKLHANTDRNFWDMHYFDWVEIDDYGVSAGCRHQWEEG